MLHDSVHVPKPSLTEVLFAWFLRLVGASCFWFALSYWAMLIGFSHNGAGRFDLLSPEWRAAATALAVVYPVAAIGLWLLVSWGPVVWVVAAATEIAMDKFYPGILGHRPFADRAPRIRRRHLRAFPGRAALSATAPGAEGKG